MTLGRADWFMPSFYHSVLLQLLHAVGPKGLRSCLTCATTACILRSLDQPGSATDWSPATSIQEPEDLPRRRMRGPQFAFFRALNSPSIRSLQCARIGLLGWKVKTIEHTTAIFRQINKSEPRTHHDALEFPDGHIELLTDLSEGQTATVLQLPAQPATPAEAQAQERVVYVG